jgi:hypothetical protein
LKARDRAVLEAADAIGYATRFPKRPIVKDVVRAMQRTLAG